MPKDRVFVAKRHTGDIPAGSVFTESDFRKLHPLPDNPARFGINPDTYHGDLLGRLISLGAIAPAAEDAEPQPIPEGPAKLNQDAERMAKEVAAPAPIPASPAPAVVAQPKAK